MSNQRRFTVEREEHACGECGRGGKWSITDSLAEDHVVGGTSFDVHSEAEWIANIANAADETARTAERERLLAEADALFLSTFPTGNEPEQIWEAAHRAVARILR